jgi:hypothetical protein
MPAPLAIPGNNHRELPTDQAIAEVARCQTGRIASRQLHELGVSTDEIEYRLRVGRLHRQMQAVYAVGAPHSSRNARRWEIILAAGPGAVLAYGAVLHLCDVVKSEQRIEVIAPRRVRRKGVIAQQEVLADDEMTAYGGIPTTTVARALLDVAGRWGTGAVNRALNQAEAEKLANYASLATIIDRHPHHPGTETIRGLLANRDPGVTLSPWEDELHDWLLERFPPPLVNPVLEINGREIYPDFAWIDEQVILEADSRFHDTPDQVDRDDERDAFLQAHRWAVVRIWKRRWRRDPIGVAGQVRAVLSRPRLVAA